MSNLSTVTSSEIGSVLDQNDYVLVDFYADWCGPCKSSLPAVEAIAQENTSLKVVKVNIDTSTDLAQRYNVRGIPTFIIFNKAEVLATKTGGVTKSALDAFITSNIKE